MNFRRYEQWFYSTEGSDIHQTEVHHRRRLRCLFFCRSEIQKRSYPNSFGGQWQDGL